MTEDSKSFSADVAVVGGGVAGLAAAVSAAREGADTYLIEHYGFLGGCALKVHRRQQLGIAALVKPSQQPSTECCVCGGDTGL